MNRHISYTSWQPCVFVGTFIFTFLKPSSLGDSALKLYFALANPSSSWTVRGGGDFSGMDSTWGSGSGSGSRI